MTETPVPKLRTCYRWAWLLLGLGLFVLILVGAGKATRHWLRHAERYSSSFADIDCPAPPGMECDTFLAEVQYLSEMPDRLSVLDDDLPARLAEVFAGHPWVEKVERVEIVPPKQVRVELLFRTPVLAVPTVDQVRAVDRHGVLLPASARTEGLPVYAGNAAPPTGPAGSVWGDKDVEEAARRAGGE